MNNKLTKLAIDAAISAGKILKEGFNTTFTIKTKQGKHNLVTEYDLCSENHILDKIIKEFPDHTFICEERGQVGDDNSDTVQWFIDPLDGTVNFAHGIPFFSVSIAAKVKGKITVGVVYNPMTDELFVAKKGEGAFLNGEKISVSKTKTFDDAFLATGFPYTLKDNPSKCIDHFMKIIRNGLPIRRLGSAAIDMAYLACGRFDAYWETTLGPWDCAAAVLLIEEAGGKVTNWEGKPFTLSPKNELIATNKIIHEEFLTNFKL